MAWYDVKLPRGLQDKNSDYVSFTLTHTPEGHNAPLQQQYNSMGCYAVCMPALPNYHYELEPCAGHAAAVWDPVKLTYKVGEPPEIKSLMSGREYFKWIRLCQDHGLVPLEAEAHRKGKLNYLTIPKRNYNRHIIYAALCCYRWSENKPRIPLTVVRLLAANPNIDFFQALHFALGKYLTWMYGNHSFLPISVLEANTYACYNTQSYGRCGFHYLPWSIVTKHFFLRRKDGTTIADEVGNACPREYGYGSTAASLGEKIKSLGLEEPAKATAPPDLAVARLEDVLREDYTPLYQTTSRDDLLRIFRVSKRKG